jgi:CheY-like chemotaxis protein
MAALNKILLVEDEPDIQTITQMALEMLGGFQVEVCSCGKDAIAAAPRYAPDLILLDVMMPGLDGPSTLKELRKIPSLARTPIVFVTAKVQRHEIEAYKTLGALDVISKPFDPMTLAANVRQIWQQAVT